MKTKYQTNYRGWEHNAFQFLREKGLEIEFSDWCGGFPCPVTVEIDNLHSLNAELLEALEPFARVAKNEQRDVTDQFCGQYLVPRDALKKALAVYAKHEETD